MHQLEWKKQARNDLLKIINYISKDSPDNADSLMDEIEAKSEKLSEHPELYRSGRMPGTREMVVHPNYIVVYRVKKNKVEILRVKHSVQQWPVSEKNDDK